MAYSACEVSVSTKNATIVDLIKANKNIPNLKSEYLSLKVVDVEDIDLCTIVCFSDGSFANLKDNSSQSGYIIFLYKNNKSFSPIAWESRKIKRVVKSILAAETLALEQAQEACFMIKSFICEIMNRQVSEKSSMVIINKSQVPAA